VLHNSLATGYRERTEEEKGYYEWYNLSDCGAHLRADSKLNDMERLEHIVQVNKAYLDLLINTNTIIDRRYSNIPQVEFPRKEVEKHTQLNRFGRY